jgi:hypothetical protein
MLCKPFGKYPGFHKIEIIAELEMPLRKQSTLRAVRDNYAVDPGIQDDRLAGRYISPNVHTPGSVLIRKLSGNSLVVSFYSNAWLCYGIQYLQEVGQLQYDISALGGQLTVVEPNEPQEDSSLNIRDYGLNLHFYFNPADLVADRFRIYPKDLHDLNANFGEENNIVGLAGYIIDNFYKVASAHMNISQGSGIRHSLLQYA